MAENKKSFLLYCDIISTVEKLSNEKAGILFKIILDYVNDKNPVVKEVLLQIAFEPIKQALKRDLKKWVLFVDKQRVNGQKGGRPPKPTETQKTQAFKNKPKKAVSVSVIDSVIEEGVFYPIEECLKISLRDPRWIDSNKATEKDLLEFNKILEKRGVYQKNPLDYKTHFANWKLNGKNFKEEVIEEKLHPRLKRI